MRKHHPRQSHDNAYRETQEDRHEPVISQGAKSEHHAYTQLCTGLQLLSYQRPRVGSSFSLKTRVPFLSYLLSRSLVLSRSASIQLSKRSNKFRKSVASSFFRESTELQDDVITTLENIILDKVMTMPIAKPKRIDTSRPMDTGMETEDINEAKSDEEQRIAEIAVQSMYKAAGHKCTSKSRQWNWSTNENQFGKSHKDHHGEGGVEEGRRTGGKRGEERGVEEGKRTIGQKTEVLKEERATEKRNK